MLDDLNAEVELVGMTVDEVEQLLGECSIRCEAYWSDMGKCDYHWGYWLDMIHGMVMNIYLLILRMTK